MTRGLLVAAGIVALAAIGAVGYVAGRNSVRPTAPAGATAGAQETVTTAKPKLATVPAVAAAPKTEAAAQPPVAVTDSAALVSALRALAEEKDFCATYGLTKEEYAHLAEMQGATAAWLKTDKEAKLKYLLPGDVLQRDPALKLTAEQQQKLQAIKAGLRGKMDESVVPLVTQYNDLLERGRAESQARRDAQEQAMKAGQPVPADPDWQARGQAAIDKLRQLEAQIRAQKDLLNQQYLGQMQSVLTPAQAQMMTDDAAIKAKSGPWSSYYFWPERGRGPGINN